MGNEADPPPNFDPAANPQVIELPLDIWFEILVALPVKYVLRCTSVCKTWDRLLQSPQFKKRHLERYLLEDARNHLLIHSANISWLSIFDAETYQKCFDVDLPSDECIIFGVYGSCNGLVCVATVEPKKLISPIYLMNPSIRKRKMLPDCDTQSKTPRFLALGFGFHDKEDDYKVVRIVKFGNKRNNFQFQAQVYSLTLDDWRFSAAAPPVSQDVNFPQPMCVFLRGALYWIAQEPSENCTSIVSFDLDGEVFGKIMFPDRLSSVLFNHIALSLRVFGESLSLFHLRDSGNSQYCDIWVVEADTWTMERTIRIPLQVSVPWPLGIRTNDRVHILGRLNVRKPTLFLYNPASTKALNTEIRMLYDLHYIDAYIENLILLDYISTSKFGCEMFDRIEYTLGDDEEFDSRTEISLGFDTSVFDI